MDKKIEETYLNIINQFDDILTPALETRQKELTDTICPNCGNKGVKSVPGVIEDTEWESNDKVIPNTAVKCPECEIVFNLESGVIIETGSLSPNNSIENYFSTNR